MGVVLRALLRALLGARGAYGDQGNAVGLIARCTAPAVVASIRIEGASGQVSGRAPGQWRGVAERTGKAGAVRAGIAWAAGVHPQVRHRCGSPAVVLISEGFPESLA